MPGPRLIRDGKVLLAVAAEVECRAVLDGLGHDPAPIRPWQLIPAARNADLVMTGVGKAAAAAGVARALNPAVHQLVLSIGIAGTYTNAPLSSIITATRSVFADEGVQTPRAFTDLAALGFPPTDAGMAIPIAPHVLAALSPLADQSGPIATVSTCSGTDTLAAELRQRTGAVAEAMEGAAVGLVAHRLAVPFGELRVISNTTGDRDRQVWRLHDALASLRAVIGPLLQAV